MVFPSACRHVGGVPCDGGFFQGIVVARGCIFGDGYLSCFVFVLFFSHACVSVRHVSTPPLFLGCVALSGVIAFETRKDVRSIVLGVEGDEGILGFVGFGMACSFGDRGCWKARYVPA